MQLYQWNFGFPLVNAETRMYTTTELVVPRDEVAQSGMGNWGYFKTPTDNFVEQVFFHSYPGLIPEQTSVLVTNHSDYPSLAILLTYSSRKLPCLAQWKMCGKGEYVLGVEPANCPVTGRNALAHDTKSFLSPQAIIEHTFIDFPTFVLRRSRECERV